MNWKLLLFFLGMSWMSYTQTLVLETGTVNLDEVTVTVNLNNTFVNPVVIVQEPTYLGNHEAIARVRNITANSFDVMIEEPIDKDGTHVFEDIYYVVIESGAYTFPSGVMLEAGTMTSSDLNFHNITFQQTYAATPAVMTQIQNDNTGTVFLKTRQQNSTTAGFEAKLEREESLNTTNISGTETIGYFAIDKGVGMLDIFNYEAGSFTATQATATYNFNAAFGGGVHYVSSIATFNGGDPASLRTISLSATSVQTFIDEDVSYDTETSHVTETIDFFAIDNTASAGVFIPSLLPVEFTLFQAQRVDDSHVRLEWQTASEVNNDYFTIEKSLDGQEWIDAVTVSGAGNSSVALNYQVLDRQSNVVGVYYRLKQTDFDGTETYTQTIKVPSEIVTKVELYPNPFVNELNIVSSDNIQSIEVYDVSGNKIAFESQSINEKQMTINFNDLDSGIYFVRINQNQVKKVIKN